MLVGNKGVPFKAGRRGRQKDQKQRTTGREAQASKGQPFNEQQGASGAGRTINRGQCSAKRRHQGGNRSIDSRAPPLNQEQPEEYMIKTTILTLGGMKF